VTPASAQATAWLERLLKVDPAAVHGSLFAVAQLARLTGDRSRDLEDASRTSAIAALERHAAPPRWKRMVEEVLALDADDEAQALGDSLPMGLRVHSGATPDPSTAVKGA